MTEQTLDRIGVWLSFGCLIHCILLPIILPLLPLLGFLFHHDAAFHLILGAGIACVAIFALVPGVFKHHNSLPLVLGFVGVGFIAAGGLAELSSAEVWWKTTLITCCGSGLLITAHYLNHKYRCKLGHHCHCEGKE
jgi:hypothetical protein